MPCTMLLYKEPLLTKSMKFELWFM